MYGLEGEGGREAISRMKGMAMLARSRRAVSVMSTDPFIGSPGGEPLAIAWARSMRNKTSLDQATLIAGSLVGVGVEEERMGIVGSGAVNDDDDDEEGGWVMC